MNGAFWKVILSSLVTASIVGGAIGLVQSNVTAAEVEDLKRRQERVEKETQGVSQKVERIDANVGATQRSVQRIEDKLDRLIERRTGG